VKTIPKRMWELLLVNRLQAADPPRPSRPDLPQYDKATLTLSQLEDLVAGRALLSDSYAGRRQMPDDALVRLFERSPGLRPLLDRLTRISGQLLAAGLRHVDVPPDAGARTARRAWLSCLLRIDSLSRLDTARVATLARGLYQLAELCPHGCGAWLRPATIIMPLSQSEN
jgi:hypothetical protein